MCASRRTVDRSKYGEYSADIWETSFEILSGVLSTLGIWFMALCVYTWAVMGVVHVSRRNFENHREWMFLYAGSMWGRSCCSG